MYVHVSRFLDGAMRCRKLAVVWPERVQIATDGRTDGQNENSLVVENIKGSATDRTEQERRNAEWNEWNRMSAYGWFYVIRS